MKVSNVSRDKYQISFNGLKREITDNNAVKYKFYLPKQDTNNTKMSVELVPLKKDGDNSWQPEKGSKHKDSYIFELVEETKSPYQSFTFNSDSPGFRSLLDEKQAFGYRYLINSKSGKLETYLDPGKCTNPMSLNAKDPKYTIVHTNRPIVSRNGVAQLIMTDIYDYGKIDKSGNFVIDTKKRKQMRGIVRNHVNKYEGNLAGVAAHARQLAKKEHVRTIVGMPFTKDTMSSHKYWTQNPFLISPDIGSLQDFKKMQAELFKNGINYFIDAALVNEGLTGVRFQHVLKWGEKSPYYNSFNINSDLRLAILPENKKNCGLRIVNDPAANTYEPQKPIYMQFFDTRLASKSQITDNKNLITTYANKNPEDNYEITSFYQTVPPYFFEITKEQLDSCRKATNTKGENIILAEKNQEGFIHYCII